MAMEHCEEIETDLISAPITALTFYQEHLLAGEGPFLNAYLIPNGQLLSQKAVLQSAVIHGICTCKGTDSHMAIFGQKSLCVITVKFKGKEIQMSILSAVCELPDWIWDVCWLEPPTQLAVVLAHNSVLRWDWKEKLVLQQVHCSENCILYSALLLGNNWDDLIIASGTVFNQVVMWKPSSKKDSSQRCAVEKRFTGHQGVIFNISYNANRKQLCTVSDDRSIRLWPTEGTTDAAVLILYGHTARVWDCKMLDKVIVSIGEDATCKVWNYLGDVLHTFTGHKGCSVWSVAVDKEEGILATGGGDSSIRLWKLDNNQHDEGSTTDLVTVHPDVVHHVQVPGGTEASLLLESSFTPRHVTVIDSGEVIVMTQCGALLGYQPATHIWRCLTYDPHYQSYSILSVSPCNKMAALGSLEGKVKVLRIDNTEPHYSEKPVYQSKVLNLIWTTADDLLVSGPDGIVDWFKITGSSSSAISLNLTTKFIIPPARQRWATAAAMLPNNEGIVCGDRRGSLHLFCHRSTNSGQNLQSQQPCHTVPGIHGKTGVTSVCIRNGIIYSTGRDGTYRQYILRRDDSLQLQLLNTFKVNRGFQWLEKIVFTSSGELQVLGFHTDQFIVWSVTRNERLMEVECGGGHRTWGFTVSNAGDGMATFACVKAQQVFIHRSLWQQRCRQSILKTALHGHQVTCVKHLASFHPVSIDDAEIAVCATGSEDTTVNIVMLHLHPSRPSHLQVLQRLQAHISRVCALASCPSLVGSKSMSSAHNQSVLLFSSGGRCALQCWRVNFKRKNESSPTEISCQVDHIVSHGTVDGVERRRLLKKSADLVDPETRYVDVTVWCDSTLEGIVHIAIAGSDACVRLFVLDETKRKLTLENVTPCHNACLLTVRYLTLQTNVPMATVIFTTATDGRILVWDTRQVIALGMVTDINTEKKKPIPHQNHLTTIPNSTLGESLLELQHHQSGINCLGIARLHSDVFLVATGGDDNSISVSILQFSSSESIVVDCLNTYKVPNAHAAQVSGIHFTSRNSLVSASVDQRVNLWKIEMTPNRRCIDKVRLIGSKFTHIADTSCMDVWSSRSAPSRVIISGQGLQVLHIPEDKL